MNNAATASTARQWTLEIDADRVAWLTFDKPGASANSLSRTAMEELDERLRATGRPGHPFRQERFHRGRRRV